MSDKICKRGGFPRRATRGMNLSPAEKLAFYSRQSSAGCILWIGSTVGAGYGQILVSGRMRLAHRVAWEAAHGPIPKGLCVLHDCPNGDNSRCINPDHLWLGTKAENNADRDRKGRAAHQRSQRNAVGQFISGMGK